MNYRPTFATFEKLAASHTLVPIYRELVGDTLTPVSAFKRLPASNWAFLFESVVGGERVGRYSFLGANPFLCFQAYDRNIRIRPLRTAANDVQEFTHPDPLRVLEDVLSRYRAPHLAELPRFCGGAVGYAGYDVARYVERLPNPPQDDRHLPDLSFALFDRMVIFDHIRKTIAVVVHAHVDSSDLPASYTTACRQVDALVEQLQQPTDGLKWTDIAFAGEVQRIPQSNYPPGGYEQAVRKCQEYINAGDIFQVVLSQRFQTETTADSFDIYRALRVLNPSPFMVYLRTPETTLVGASPEIMARVENGIVTVRPLAGTRKRGFTPEEDQRLAEELLADPKERAEHIMLVDLGRNDVGRIAQYGSVQLSDLLTVERYSHVMHISSTVQGKLLPDKTAFDALRSCLPAGTLSGAPKIRAMEIIDELEPHRRGPYGGAIGYIDFSGNMDTCIALRTLVLIGQTAYIQAGAGIVADSVPHLEYQETVNKAMSLFRAIEIAETQFGSQHSPND